MTMMRIFLSLNGQEDFRNKTMRFILLLISCVFFGSCIQPAAGVNGSAAIRNILDNQVNSYEKKEQEAFLENISRQYYPNYEEFRSAIEDFLRNNAGINLEFSIEKILGKGKEQSVDVKWYKTYSDRRGNLRKLEGQAILIFNVSGEKPYLINIKGDNPFTQ